MSSSGLVYAIAGLPLRLDFGGSGFGGSDFARESFGCLDVEEAFDFFLVLDGMYTGNASLTASAFLRNCFLDADISLGTDGATGAAGVG